MEALQARLKKLNKERDTLFKLRQPIDTAMTKNWKAIERTQKAIAKKKIKEMGDTPDWKVLLASAHDWDSVEILQYFDKAVSALGMWGGGRWSDGGQPIICIKLTHGDEKSLQDNIDGVKFFIPCYKPDKEGFVWFDLFEYGLSQHASYAIKIKKKTKQVTLVTTRYSRSETKALGGIEKAMAYLQEHHWYDGKKSEDNDYDL